MGELQTPVVMILFNRPDLTHRVFAAVRAARPRRLFLIADGPRPEHAEDAALCAAVRAAATQVSWSCQVEVNFAEANLGCGYRVASGLDWVFSQVDEAIILEDDILPDPSFFPYCQALLAHYRDTAQVMGIGGRNDMGIWQPQRGSYFFHRHPAIWGWATWRRAWRHFDLTLDRYRAWDVAGLLSEHLADPEHAALKTALFQRYAGIPVDTWDVQWALACLLRGGIWISPTVNLAANLGFDERATHTTQSDDLRRHIPVGQMTQPLRHPATNAAAAATAIEHDFDRAVFLLQMTNSFRDVRKLRLWQRALAQNPELPLPGMFDGGRHTLAPLRHPAETLRVLHQIAPYAAEDTRLTTIVAALAAAAREQTAAVV